MSTFPIGSYIVEDWFNGLYSATMLITVWVILSNTHYSHERRNWLLAMVIVMYTCSTVHSSLHWASYSQAIDINELPNGPGLSFSLTHLQPWVEATGDTFFCLNIFLADCLFIWRCWVVWQRRWVVVLIPMLATIAGAVLGGLVISFQVIARDRDASDTVIKDSETFVTFSTAYFALSISTSLMTTFLIALKIGLIQRSTKKAGVKTRNPYSAIVEILVESAVLYSATLLTFVVLNTQKSINVLYAQNIHAQIAGLAPMLIILRVAAGHSRPDEEWSTRINSDLHFAHSSGTQIHTNLLFAPSGSTVVQGSRLSHCDGKDGRVVIDKQ